MNAASMVAFSSPRIKDHPNSSTSMGGAPTALPPEYEATSSVVGATTNDLLPVVSLAARLDTLEQKDKDYRLRCLQELSVSEHRSQYIDAEKGPLRPGFHFYRWLGTGPPLQIPIPDSILIDGPNIRRLNNDARGFIVSSKPKYDIQASRDEFIISCIESFVAQSSPMGMQPHMTHLRGRFVAVQKSPCINPRSLVTNIVECLTPLAFQATLVEHLDNASGNCILQKVCDCQSKCVSLRSSTSSEIQLSAPFSQPKLTHHFLP